jgi:rhodanese-related sulfurtransferase
MSEHRTFKDSLYTQFARIGRALASPKRIELLDLLAQGEKSVEVLAEQIGTPVKNTSAHLRVLRQACLVERRTEGTFVFYRIANDDVLDLVRSMQRVAQSRLADIRQVVGLYLDGKDQLDPVTLDELKRLRKDSSIVVVDVRPHDEYLAGHIPGALSIPVANLKNRLKEIPKNREVVAYCRGRYCVYSLDAVTLLRKHGYRARRLNEGLPDWRAAGFPVDVSQ